MDISAEDVEIGRTPGGASVVLRSTNAPETAAGLRGLLPVDRTMAMGRSLRIVTGLDGVETTDSTQDTSPTSSIWLPDAEALGSLSAMHSKHRAAVITDLTRGGALLASSIEDLRILTSWVPVVSSRMHLLPDDFGTWADQWIKFAWGDLPKVVVHDTAGSTELSGALVLREDIDSLDRASTQLAAWLPAPADRRDDQTRIEPRLSAWYLNSAVAEHGARLLVVDRPEVASALVNSPNVTVPLALSVPPDWHDHALAEDARGTRRLIREISASRCMLLARTEVQRDLLVRQGFTDRVRVLDLRSAQGWSGLQRMADLGSTGMELSSPRTLLMAGHDFKFAGELVELLRSVSGLHLKFDKWPRQNHHSVDQSDAQLKDADIIFCEFASHNAIWYSWHKRPNQRLIVRFHGYELFQDFVHDINMANVDAMVFVSEFYRDRVVAELGWPRSKTVVVHNMIDAFDLDRAKHPDARFHLGIAGIVPILKRPDRALDLLEQLLAEDDRYVLHVRGRSPWDYGWMWQNPVTQDAYRAFYERLAENPRLLGHVAFDAFGADMGRWFQRIGWMLSPSSRETFHLAPVEGGAGGAIPVVWQRDGAEEIFGANRVHQSTADAAATILQINGEETSYESESQRAREHARRFDVAALAPQWTGILFPDHEGDQNPDHGVDARFDRLALRDRYDELGTAAALDRLLLGLLSAPGTIDEALELVEEHRDELTELSAETRRRIDSARERRALRSGAILRPPRSIGAAYLTRSGVVMAIGNEMISAPEQDAAAEGQMADGPAPEDCWLPVGLPDEDPELIGAGSAARSVLERIQIAADALTRRARVLRPQALCVARGSAVSAWAGLLAARRLGLPLAALSETPHENGPSDDEFDGFVKEFTELGEGVVQELQRRHDERVDESGQKSLDQVTIGIISDEFTERTIAERCAVVHIPREEAYLTVASQQMDALFVESAWTGRDGEWFHGVAYYKDSRTDIEQAVRVARSRGIPVIFWNKEDPVHFRSFAPTAALCDVVFTTDAGRIAAYLDNDEQGRNRAVASMPFFAEPRLHHPLPGSWTPRQTASYAGTYYGARYADRSAELDRILAAAQSHGLTIYDRQRNHPDSPYAFPDRYADSIAGGLAYDEVLQAYKAHPVHINVNSVNDSPSMFSRRVVEVAASGSVVVSGKGRGVQESIPEIPVSDDAEVLGHIMAECLGDSSSWRRRAWQQLRGVRRSYLGQHALTIMLRAAGLPISCAAAPPWTAVFRGALDETAARDLLRQTLLPEAVLVPDGEPDPQAEEILAASGVRLDSDAPTEWVAVWEPGRPDTWAEDMMHAAEFVPDDVTTIGARTAVDGEYGLMSWSLPELPVPFVRWGQSEKRAISWIVVDEQEEGADEHDR